MSPSNSNDDPIVLAYWDIRGLVQATRYVLEYGDVKYEDRRYKFGEKLDGRKIWLKEKFSLGLAFPNMPYLKSGDVVMTQSLAILRFAARRAGLFPNTERGQWLVDMAEQQLNEIMWHNSDICYHKEYNDKMKDDYMKQYLDTRCPQLDAFLSDRQFIAGDQLTYADFLAYEMFDQHRTLWPEYKEMHAPFPHIEAYLQRMEALPKFAKFLKSDKFKAWPVWSERSRYGGPQMDDPRLSLK